MPLYKLGIPPDRTGYKVKQGNGAVAIQLDGGAPRVRGDKLGVVSTVDVQWTVNESDFDYLMAFSRSGAGANGVPCTLPFLIDLVGIDNAEVGTYMVWFVPNTFGLISQAGLTYIVGAQLWVVPNTPSNADDLQTMGKYS